MVRVGARVRVRLTVVAAVRVRVRMPRDTHGTISR